MGELCFEVDEFAGEADFFGFEFAAQAVQAVGQAGDITGHLKGLVALAGLDDADDKFTAKVVHTVMQSGDVFAVLVVRGFDSGLRGFILAGAGIVGGSAARLFVQGRKAAIAPARRGARGVIAFRRWYVSDSHFYPRAS